jgi:hypothetical protein
MTLVSEVLFDELVEVAEVLLDFELLFILEGLFQ